MSLYCSETDAPWFTLFYHGIVLRDDLAVQCVGGSHLGPITIKFDLPCPKAKSLSKDDNFRWSSFSTIVMRVNEALKPGYASGQVLTIQGTRPDYSMDHSGGKSPTAMLLVQTLIPCCFEALRYDAGAAEPGDEKLSG